MNDSTPQPDANAAQPAALDTGMGMAPSDQASSEQAPSEQASTQPAPVLSIIVPALNEADNVEPLVSEIKQHLVDKGIAVELIIVDDGSTDATAGQLAHQAKKHAWLKPLHRPQAKGQSAAMHAGIQAATAPFIATLDADLQNDPADLVPMLERLQADQADMIQGDRSQNRKDHLVRKLTSRIGRWARRLLIGDQVRDTGCSARVVKAALAKQFPLQFKGMHRFLPAYAAMTGARVIEMPVNHRPRIHGTTKYGLGIVKRGWQGGRDLLAVRWMINRYRTWDVTAINPAKPKSGKTNPGKTNPGKTKAVVPDQARPKTDGMPQAKPEPAARPVEPAGTRD